MLGSAMFSVVAWQACDLNDIGWLASRRQLCVIVGIPREARKEETERLERGRERMIRERAPVKKPFCLLIRSLVYLEIISYNIIYVRPGSKHATAVYYFGF